MDTGSKVALYIVVACITLMTLSIIIREKQGRPRPFTKAFWREFKQDLNKISGR